MKGVIQAAAVLAVSEMDKGAVVLSFQRKAYQTSLSVWAR
jgi:hypothetical protein